MVTCRQRWQSSSRASINRFAQIGKRDLVEAAMANASPNSGIGRSMKVGKEEIMGLLAAVQQWILRDHNAEWLEWEKRLQVIAAAATSFQGVTAEFKSNRRRKSNVAPELVLRWNATELGGLTPAEVEEAFDVGAPRIQCFGPDNTLTGGTIRSGGISFMPVCDHALDIATACDMHTRIVTGLESAKALPDGIVVAAHDGSR